MSSTSVFVLHWITSACRSTGHTVNVPHVLLENYAMLFQSLAPMNDSLLRTRAVPSIPMVLILGYFLHSQDLEERCCISPGHVNTSLAFSQRSVKSLNEVLWHPCHFPDSSSLSLPFPFQQKTAQPKHLLHQEAFPGVPFPSALASVLPSLVPIELMSFCSLRMQLAVC